MLPTLNVAGLALPTAPLLTIISFWVATWLAAREGKRLGLNEDVIFNASFYGALAGLIGARLWYVLRFWPFYADRPGEIFSLNLITLASFEGIVTGIVVAVIYLQRSKIRGARFLDALAPGLAALAVGLSLADLAAGTAFGAPAELPWSISLWNTSRHPTQIYDAILSLGILIVSLRMLRDRPLPMAGRIFGVFVVLLSATRLFSEGFRGDSTLFGDGWRTMQFVWMFLMLVTLIVLARTDTRHKAVIEQGEKDG